MRKIIAVLCLSIFFLSCKKSKKEEVVACGVKNPLENISWLKQKKEALQGGPSMNSITLYSYNGKEVIQVHSAIYSFSYGYQYDCEGKQLMKDDTNEIKLYIAGRKKIATLYGTFDGLQ